jgi:hypothetical protein
MTLAMGGVLIVILSLSGLNVQKATPFLAALATTLTGSLWPSPGSMRC